MCLANYIYSCCVRASPLRCSGGGGGGGGIQMVIGPCTKQY